MLLQSFVFYNPLFYGTALYKEWFLSERHLARPGYVISAKNLRKHMPELAPIYERLVELAGGGDLAARFLSMYRPPSYLLGCSQAVWSGRDPALVRNYDYSPELFDGSLLYTSWRRRVIAMSDCGWGVLSRLPPTECVALGILAPHQPGERCCQ